MWDYEPKICSRFVFIWIAFLVDLPVRHKWGKGFLKYGILVTRTSEEVRDFKLPQKCFSVLNKKKEREFLKTSLQCYTSAILLSPCREGMSGYVRSEHAAVRWSVTTRDCGHVCWPVLLPQRLQWRVTDPARWFPNVPGLRLPLWPHAQVGAHKRCCFSTDCQDLSKSFGRMCPDWSRPRRMNPKMHWRIWSTLLPAWPHTVWQSWNLLVSQLGPPSYSLVLFSPNLLGKVCYCCQQFQNEMFRKRW